MTLANADAIYACCERATTIRYWVPSFELRDFMLSLRRLDAALGDERHNGYWRPARRALWRFWLGACGTPLPFFDQWLLPPLERQFTLERLDDGGNTYPNAAPAAAELRARLEKLLITPENPLWTETERVLAGPAGSVGILIRDSRAIPAVERFLAGRRWSRGGRVLSSAELSGAEPLDRLLVLGPICWFADGVVQSPRATEIHVLTPTLFRDRWTGRPALEGSMGAATSLVCRQIHTAPGDDSFGGAIDEGAEPGDLFPRVDWEAVAERAGAIIDSDGTEDLVEARLLLLEGERAVFVDGSDHARALVLDLQDYDHHSGASGSVARISTQDIEAGEFLLLRTEGGGDYILPVAERMLGSYATPVHATQRDWKGRLRRREREEGPLAVALALLERGSLLANEGNVRNWASEGNIKPRNRSDFVAIMRLVGLEEVAEAYWKNARMIDLAHKRAGQRIRRLLIDQIPKTDLARLVQLGSMDFELGDVGGGRLTAYRVTAAPRQRYVVPSSRLGQPFDPEDEPWRA